MEWINQNSDDEESTVSSDDEVQPLISFRNTFVQKDNSKLDKKKTEEIVPLELKKKLEEKLPIEPKENHTLKPKENLLIENVPEKKPETLPFQTVPEKKLETLPFQTIPEKKPETLPLGTVPKITCAKESPVISFDDVSIKNILSRIKTKNTSRNEVVKFTRSTFFNEPHGLIGDTKGVCNELFDEKAKEVIQEDTKRCGEIENVKAPNEQIDDTLESESEEDSDESSESEESDIDSDGSTDEICNVLKLLQLFDIENTKENILRICTAEKEARLIIDMESHRNFPSSLARSFEYVDKCLHRIADIKTKRFDKIEELIVDLKYLESMPGLLKSIPQTVLLEMDGDKDIGCPSLCSHVIFALTICGLLTLSVL